MKKFKSYASLLMLMTLALFTSCDDYDIIGTDYDEDMQEKPARESATPPDIKAEWDLELIPDVGRQADDIFVYKDLKYNKMFSRPLGWTGGDGGISTPLPDGSVLWSFNESYFGCVDATKRARLNANIPRNTLIIQHATNGVLGETQDDLICLADYVNWEDATAENYMWGRTYLRHPNGNKSAEQIAAGEIDNTRIYRVGAATAASGRLQMLWFGTMAVTGKSNAITLSSHDLNGTIPTGRYTADLPDYLPREGDYMYMEDVKHLMISGSTMFGQSILTDGNHIYLYGPSNNSVAVARTTSLDLSSTWEYYIRDAVTGQMQWQATYPSSDEIARSLIMANSYLVNNPCVFKKGDTYYMLSQGSGYSTSVYLYRSATPFGPFTDEKLLFNLPSYLDKLGITTYGQVSKVILHEELSRDGELVISACTSADDSNDNYLYAGSADFSRPWFFRIYNWESIYSESTE